MSESSAMKTCKKCGHVFESARCNKCNAANSAKWRAANPDKEKEARRKWREENKSIIKKLSLQYYDKNKELIKEKVSDYRKSNPEKAAAAVERCHRRNPEYIRLKSQNRRARIKFDGGKLSKGIEQKLLNLQRGKCACCGQPIGDDYHLDHIMPLALGGSHSDDNIQLLKSACNIKKNAKHPIDFMQSKGFLL